MTGEHAGLAYGRYRKMPLELAQSLYPSEIHEKVSGGNFQSCNKLLTQLYFCNAIILFAPLLLIDYLRGENMKRILFIAFLLLTLLMLVVPGTMADRGNNNGKGAENSREVKLQILAINDFHGNIATTSSSFGGVGRADYLAANIAAAEAEAEAEGSNTIFVSAGDLIGASPLDLRPLPRRADDRGDEPDWPGHQRRGQP